MFKGFVVLVAAGCMAQPPTGETESAIYNAYAVDTKLGTVYFRDTYPSSGYYCSATMLSEHWTLTAAHCLSGEAFYQWIYVWYRSTDNPLYFGPAELFISPSYTHQGSGGTYDVALVHLTGSG